MFCSQQLSEWHSEKNAVRPHGVSANVVGGWLESLKSWGTFWHWDSDLITNLFTVATATQGVNRQGITKKKKSGGRKKKYLRQGYSWAIFKLRLKRNAVSWKHFCFFPQDLQTLLSINHMLWRKVKNLEVEGAFRSTGSCYGPSQNPAQEWDKKNIQELAVFKFSLRKSAWSCKTDTL